jgi:membrane-associated phospholipid phosphatase
MHHFYRALFLLIFVPFLANSMEAQPQDLLLLKKINTGRNTHLDPEFRFVSNTMIPLACAVPLGLMGTGLNNKNQVLTTQGVVCGASLLLCTAITVSFKYTVKRKRPFVISDEIQQAAPVGPFSFPSGHTSTAFATATAISLAYPKWYVIAPSFAWAAVVAYSRLHLGVHFPSDVLAGMLIGVGSSLLCHEAQYWIRK